MFKKTKLFSVLSLLIVMVMLLSMVSFADTVENTSLTQTSEWANKGWASLYKGQEFQPDKNLNRIEVVALVNSLFNFEEEGEISFSDVPTDSQYYGEVSKAFKAGYIKGRSDEIFDPEGKINGVEVYMIIARILKLDLDIQPDQMLGFKDADEVPQWAVGAVESLVQKGLRKDKSKIKPLENLLGSEVVELLEQFADEKAVALPVINMASTIGPIDAGILDELINLYYDLTKIKVEYVGAGTGKAIEMSKSGNFDLVMVHAKVLEEQFVAEGFGTERIDLMYNDFVIVGPENDPAGIKGMDPTQALNKIKETESYFISRADKSGTHVKEEELWEEAGLVPEGDWYEAWEDGNKGNAATLRYTNEQQAYTIIDRATYLTLKEEINLAVLVEGYESLLNFITLIPVNPEKFPQAKYEMVMEFVDFLTSDEAQMAIHNFKVDVYGESLFFPNSAKYREKGLIEQEKSPKQEEEKGGGKSPLNFQGAFFVSIDNDKSTELAKIEDSYSGDNIIIKLVFDRGIVRENWDNNKEQIMLQDHDGNVVESEIFKIDGSDDEKSHIFIKPLKEIQSGEYFNIIIGKDLMANNGNTLGKEEVVKFSIK